MTEAFPERLKESRSRLKLSQKEISEKLGISQTAYSSYESRGVLPPLATVEKLADILDVSIDWLLARDKRSELRTYADIAEYLNVLAKKIGIEVKVEHGEIGYNPKQYVYTCNIRFGEIIGSSRKNEPEDIKEGYAQAIAFSKYLVAWGKIYNLHLNQTITEDLFLLWCEREISKLKGDPPHHFYADQSPPYGCRISSSNNDKSNLESHKNDSDNT